MGENKGWEVFIDPIELVFCITKEWNSIASYYPLNPATCSLFFFSSSGLTAWRRETVWVYELMEEKNGEGRCGIPGWGLGMFLDKDMNRFVRQTHPLPLLMKSNGKGFFRKACWLVVCLSCNINWHCCCCSSEKPSVQNSYFSLPNDLFTATLNWTVIRLLQVGSVVSALTCFWKWIDSLRSLEKWRKIFTIELPELKRRNLTDKQWIN